MSTEDLDQRGVTVGDLLAVVGTYASDDGTGTITTAKLIAKVSRRFSVSRRVAAVLLDGAELFGWITFSGPLWHLTVPAGLPS